MDERRETMGSLNISDDVVATIAGLAATEIDGVSKLSNGPLNNIKSIFGAINQSSAKSIQLSVDDGVAAIDVFVTLKYGAKIPEVAEKIQENVKNNVQNMTGIAVAKVNVHICGVDFADSNNCEE